MVIHHRSRAVLWERQTKRRIFANTCTIIPRYTHDVGLSGTDRMSKNSCPWWFCLHQYVEILLDTNANDAHNNDQCQVISKEKVKSWCSSSVWIFNREQNLWWTIPDAEGMISHETLETIIFWLFEWDNYQLNYWRPSYEPSSPLRTSFHEKYRLKPATQPWISN
jgi:hypothetical protein